eukprot:COSAG01_NODE_2184_length_8207_cov_30.628762_5_plen_263_part_00
MYRYMYSARCAQGGHFRTRVRTRTEIRRVRNRFQDPSDLPTYRVPEHRAMCTAYHCLLTRCTDTLVVVPDAGPPPGPCGPPHCAGLLRPPHLVVQGPHDGGDWRRYVGRRPPSWEHPGVDDGERLPGERLLGRRPLDVLPPPPPPFPPSPCPLCPWSCPLSLPLLSPPCSVSLCAAGGAQVWELQWAAVLWAPPREAVGHRSGNQPASRQLTATLSTQQPLILLILASRQQDDRQGGARIQDSATVLCRPTAVVGRTSDVSL